MRLHILATAFAITAALSITSPADAGNVPIDYTLTVTYEGQTAPLGTMILGYNGSTYSLDSLDVGLPDKTVYVTSDVTLASVPGTSDYCVYSLTSCSIVPDKNSVYFIFDPSLISQTTTLFVYSTKSLGTESAALTLQQAAVPEPATWAMMLLGFASIGTVLRRSRRPAAPRAA